MKIDYDNIKETKPRWKVGDVIYGHNDGFYSVTMENNLKYTLINLNSNYSTESYSTVEELQRHLYEDGDRIINRTLIKILKYVFRGATEDK